MLEDSGFAEGLETVNFLAKKSRKRFDKDRAKKYNVC